MESQFRKSSATANQGRLHALMRGGVVLASLLLLLIGLGASTDASPVVTGPAAAWGEQVAAAQKQARSVDADAVLSLAEAVPVAAVEGSALTVRFGFLTPGRGLIWVSLDDTQPAQSVALVVAGTPGVLSTPANTLAALGKASEQVSLGPRDALRIVTAKTDVATRGYTLSQVTLHVGDSVSAETKVAAAWSVHFVTSDGNYGVEYTIDARTGKIVRRGDEDSMCRMR